ncbi:MAG: homocitrate synthase [Planctomycetes bacterium]|nr:homocitrate synthase [Planctomycetota bacterium]
MNPLQNRPLQLVDSTLREGEQHLGVSFSPDSRVRIARALDALGIDLIEVTSPAVSALAAADLRALSGLGLNARIATHVRCHLVDVDLAIKNGAQALHLFFGMSPQQRAHSHGRGLAEIFRRVEEVVRPLQGCGLEVRVSAEDAFRTPLNELLEFVELLNSLDVQRIGLADTVGTAIPEQVADVVSAVRGCTNLDIEFHGHNDIGCATANAYSAWKNGASHLDTTVLGLGERNGISPLASLLACFAVHEPEAIASLDLHQLPRLDRIVSRASGVAIPFNACVTGKGAFSHKAGLHSKAMLNHSSTYEGLAPQDFGLERRILLAHRLVGRAALADRAAQLGLRLLNPALTTVANRIKAWAELGPLSLNQVDAFLHEASTLTPLNQQ